MKIEKLILENFAAIKNAMNTKRIEIDFSNTENKVCILIGPNGSGKTTLLSLLHPFSDLGNLDVRNGNKLILENKDGYKEIHISKGDDYYIIKHFYTHHKEKNHSVKSYIEKNGNDLNPNGNVTSFKEYVKLELQIEPDYLKLIRLGSNVTNLINLSSTERKNFMSKIMEEIDIYLEYYKAVNTKIRQLDDMISHTVDKMNKIDIVDKKDEENNIKKMKEDKKSLESDFYKLNEDIITCKNKIDDIDDVDNLTSNLQDITKKYKKMLKVVESYGDIKKLDLKYYEDEIDKLNQRINSSKSEHGANLMIIKNHLESLDVYQNQLHSYEVQIEKELESSKELEKMNNNVITIRKKLREIEASLGEYEANYSSAEIINFYTFLKNTQQILRTVYEFGGRVVKKVVELLRNGTNVPHYINSHIVDIDTTNNSDSSLMLLSKLSSILSKDIIFSCKEECQAKTIISQLQDLIKSSEVDDKSESYDFYHDMDLVYQNLIKIIPKFAQYKELILKLPNKEDFSMDSLYKKIAKTEMIYDDKAMNLLVSKSLEYDEYVNLTNKLTEAENSLDTFKSLSKSNVSSLYDELVDTINSTKIKIGDLKQRNSDLDEVIQESSDSLESMIDIRDTIIKFDSTKDEFERLNHDFKVFTENENKKKEAILASEKLSINIENLNNDIQNRISKLDQYVSLNKDLKKMNSAYDDMVVIKEALSSKQGIPLFIIQNYLNNTEVITNELLDIAYDGNIYIDNFHITPTEFTIPFYNKGVLIPDVKYASQGELSFLSIALSFALSSQALSKYNIMLLDEIDGPLDSKNREKFIDILEDQIERIDSEQNFLITHNNMFSSYPVDIIDLSNKKDTSKYPLATFIEICKS